MGLKDDDLEGDFRSSNLIVWCPGWRLSMFVMEVSWMFCQVALLGTFVD